MLQKFRFVLIPGTVLPAQALIKARNRPGLGIVLSVLKSANRVFTSLGVASALGRKVTQLLVGPGIDDVLSHLTKIGSRQMNN